MEKGKYLIDYVICQVCGGKYRIIRVDHLRKHDMTFDDYKKRFPKAETHCKKTCEAIRKKATGRIQTAEHIKKRVAYFIGRSISDEQKKAISIAQTGRKHTPESITSRFTPEANARRADKMRGRKLSVEHREKISKRMKQRGLPPQCISPEAKTKRADTIAKQILEGTYKSSPGRGKQSYYFSSKMNKDIHCHSTYEYKACEVMDDDPLIIEFYKHPYRIPYSKTDGSVHDYFPDFGVVRVNGDIVVVEIKPEYQIKTPVNILKFKAAEDYCKNINQSFEVWTEKRLGIN